ncbi:5-formyltetrahydrofolate cyclo-ligase [Candidatus Symbiopectobacterium sp. 'North America']|uniref:5-formyltetrahydrofolate cyclo-ligase n=1 Tax=Candidatus Symbiopectobacterium sp. 'North America' TaxID=2794574 RepID=UPI001E13EF65|nr:5-formyltetrahydrofolate cyclo-ligase [Candidatus Symbiopectobacterium sp. 'North America']MBG6244596.1 5-formyltetrahydrofolate cyclo-ligase [Candidatus Symbiopectobacterium sp. 'North America']
MTSASMHVSPQQQRQAMRDCVRQLRRALTQEQQTRFAQQIAERALEQPEVQQAQRIALFLSFDGELDTQPLIARLWQQGKAVYLPVLHSFSPGHLLFLHYDAQTLLVKNRLKIFEPRLDVRRVLPLIQLDVLFTPLVAFDAQGQRLGMGGGFYDRTLQRWQQRGPYPIGLAHDCQQVDAIPNEAWDIPLPAILTPSRRWQW